LKSSDVEEHKEHSDISAVQGKVVGQFRRL